MWRCRGEVGAWLGPAHPVHVVHQTAFTGDGTDGLELIERVEQPTLVHLGHRNNCRDPAVIAVHGARVVLGPDGVGGQLGVRPSNRDELGAAGESLGPEAPNRSQHRIPSTNQLSISTGTK